MKFNTTPLLLVLAALVLTASIPADLDSKSLKKDLKKTAGIEQVLVSPLETNTNGSLKGKFYKIASHDSAKLIGYMYAGRVDCCRAGGCGSGTPISDDALESEYFDYYILFDTNHKVETVRVTNYEATYGHEITARSWLKQFVGFGGEEELRPGKEIDGISGATISVYAITADIEHKTKVLGQILQP